MQVKTLLILLIVGFLTLSFSQTSISKLLFHDDFEKDKIGSEPSQWEMAHKGGGQKATAIKDPDDAKNQVMSSSSAPAGSARHDAGGSMYVTGDPNWTDYVCFQFTYKDLKPWALSSDSRMLSFQSTYKDLKQLKELKDTKDFSKIDPATKGSDGDFKKGRFGNYGLVYLDNIFIGDTVEDLVLPVSQGDKLSSTWGKIKNSYQPEENGVTVQVGG